MSSLYLKLKPKKPMKFLRPFSTNDDNPKPLNFLSDIKQHLKSKDSTTPPPQNQTPKPPPSLSFQQLFKSNLLNNNNPQTNTPPPRVSFDSIRESLRNFQKSTSANPPPRRTFQNILRPNAIGSDSPLPESVFGPELKQKKDDANSPKTPKFLRPYNHDELGRKLRKLRPEGFASGGDFSIEELSERVGKVIEMEEKESSSVMSPLTELMHSIQQVKSKEDAKKKSMPRVSILGSLGGLMTPKFLQEPPQEELLERYFHPDHMSSEEKMKVELQKVRDEFKMHENDCGSARVQVATLTTKIKHLSSVLHKKDKHSRKGLQDMVQLRKKLLKYLRRTDWDSYCLVISRLGLRDVPEYKAPDYKKAPDSKTKKKMKA